LDVASRGALANGWKVLTHTTFRAKMGLVQQASLMGRPKASLCWRATSHWSSAKEPRNIQQSCIMSPIRQARA